MKTVATVILLQKSIMQIMAFRMKFEQNWILIIEVANLDLLEPYFSNPKEIDKKALRTIRTPRKRQAVSTLGFQY